MKRRSVQQKTREQHCQDIVNEYMRAHPGEAVDMRKVAAWAVRKGLWQPRRRSALKQCAHELSRAARNEYFTDPGSGREVRMKHAAKYKEIKDGEEVQYVLWADIRQADPKHMRLSLQQRRQGIVGDCTQLRVDSDFYNKNNSHGAEIQLGLDFTEDVEERLLPGDYINGDADGQS